jgi:hypothetical protein
MFHSPRHFFNRTAAPAPASDATPPTPTADTASTMRLHPAMRGLNVSPVHGRHCICNRCSGDRAA